MLFRSQCYVAGLAFLRAPLDFAPEASVLLAQLPLPPLPGLGCCEQWVQPFQLWDHLCFFPGLPAVQLQWPVASHLRRVSDRTKLGPDSSPLHQVIAIPLSPRPLTLLASTRLSVRAQMAQTTPYKGASHITISLAKKYALFDLQFSLLVR